MLHKFVIADDNYEPVGPDVETLDDALAGVGMTEIFRRFTQIEFEKDLAWTQEHRAPLHQRRCPRHDLLKQLGYTIARDPAGEFHTYRPDGT